MSALKGCANENVGAPQMLASYRVAADNALWELTLREGADVARQHAVLARDCVASIL